MTPPRYLKAATRGVARVRFYKVKYQLPMRRAHAEMKAALTRRIALELVRHNALPPQG